MTPKEYKEQLIALMKNYRNDEGVCPFCQEDFDEVMAYDDHNLGTLDDYHCLCSNCAEAYRYGIEVLNKSR